MFVTFLSCGLFKPRFILAHINGPNENQEHVISEVKETCPNKCEWGPGEFKTILPTSCLKSSLFFKNQSIRFLKPGSLSTYSSLITRHAYSGMRPTMDLTRSLHSFLSSNLYKTEKQFIRGTKRFAPRLRLISQGGGKFAKKFKVGLIYLFYFFILLVSPQMQGHHTAKN